MFAENEKKRHQRKKARSAAVQVKRDATIRIKNGDSLEAWTSKRNIDEEITVPARAERAANDAEPENVAAALLAAAKKTATLLPIRRRFLEEGLLKLV